MTSGYTELFFGYGVEESEFNFQPGWITFVVQKNQNVNEVFYDIFCEIQFKRYVEVYRGPHRPPKLKSIAGLVSKTDENRTPVRCFLSHSL